MQKISTNYEFNFKFDKIPKDFKNVRTTKSLDSKSLKIKNFGIAKNDEPFQKKNIFRTDSFIKLNHGMIEKYFNLDDISIEISRKKSSDESDTTSNDGEYSRPKEREEGNVSGNSTDCFHEKNKCLLFSEENEIKRENQDNKKSLSCELEEEIYDETVNQEKVFYLTNNITEFYNNYIGICEKGILIDKNKYPLLENPKISVIIPLYNATKFLHYCLRSVQNQKMKEIEIILVEDCSTDNTLFLVNKYMEEDPRIRLIKNKENRKILYSKSIGALNAKGKYILQLDQDDLFIRDDLFDILYNEAESDSLDLVQFKDLTTDKLYLSNKTRVNMHKRYQIKKGNTYEPMTTHYETNEELKNKLFIDGYVYTLWGLLIKTDIYKKAINSIWQVILNYKFTYYEDYLMTTLIIAFTENYKFLNSFGLVHLKHRNSAMVVFSENIFTYLLIFEQVLYKYYINNGNDKDIKIILNLLKRYSYSYKNYYEKYQELFKEIISEILSNQYITKDDANFVREAFEISSEDFNHLNSYEYLMNKDEYMKISKFQDSIINTSPEITNINVNEIKFSIIIYCVGFEHLKNTINSILNQNFKSYEIIIVYDNDNYLNLKLIKDYIKYYKNINLINNETKKGLLFSYSKAGFSSKGDFILLLKQGETLAKNNVLINLYEITKNEKIDILEFNLLLNKYNTINNDSLYLYRCTHFKSFAHFESIEYDKKFIDLDQENDILTNYLINKNYFKNIINKYKLLENQEKIYNYYNEIFLFLFSKEENIFKRINEYGIIKYVNDDKNIFYNIINNNHQKIQDGIFYINFLFENTPDSPIDKKAVVNKFVYLLNIIYNRFNESYNKSKILLLKFLNCKFISIEDKINLQFYYDSLIN